MEYAVPFATILILIFNIFVSLAIPIFLYIVLRKRGGASRLPFFIGVAIFVLFAMVLENIVHVVALRTTNITQSPWLFALYGGLMAGLFEESGRYAAFRVVLRKRMKHSNDALMFGAGHGGVEVLIVFTVAMVTNLIYALSIYMGKGPAMLASLEGEQLGFTTALFTTLSTTAPALYLMGLVERFFAVILHLSFSVLVWAAVKEAKKIHLFWLAFLLHVAVDMIAVLLSQAGVSVLLIEVVVALFAAGTAIVAQRVHKTLRARETVAPSAGESG